MSTSISNIHRSRDEVIVEMLRVNLDRSGADPSEFFDSLAAAVMHRVWEMRGMTFLEFLEAPFPDGVGVEWSNLKKLLEIEHRAERRLPEVKARMDSLRADVRDLANEPLSRHGEAGKYRGLRDGNTISEPTNNTDYIVRRLKRDDPELAERVIAGEVSANAAAVQAGIRKAKATVTADPQGVARWVRKNFTPEQIAELVEALR